MNARRKSRKNKSSLIFLIFLTLLIIAGIIGWRIYKGIFYSNIQMPDPEIKSIELYIPTGSDFDEVLDIICKANILKHESSFRLLAEKMNYPANVYAGRYIVKKGWSNYELIRKLRAGESDPLMLTIDKVFTVEEIASAAGRYLEIDSQQIMAKIYDAAFLKEHHLSKNTALTFFIPDSYEFYWNITVDGFINRMKKEYDRFWTDERLETARSIGLKPAEVYILASIVQEEASVKDELPRIAGVYMNRLRKGMRLEADPTVRFLVRHRDDKKVYLRDYKIASPYNTYQNSGLPPGPIIITRKESMDAVLNFERHKYLFFVVKHDGSGRHVFTENYEQHKYYRNLWLKSKKNR